MRVGRAAAAWNLELGTRNFPGAWNLELGTYIRSPQFAPGLAGVRGLVAGEVGTDFGEALGGGVRLAEHDAQERVGNVGEFGVGSGLRVESWGN
jgi:hypothetical protein